MSDYDKLKIIYDEIDDLIIHHVTATTPAFIKWHTKLERFLLRKYGNQSKEYTDFNNRTFSPMVYSYAGRTDYVGPCRKELEITKAEISVYLEELKEELEDNQLKEKEQIDAIPKKEMNFSKVFIVHGHSESLKQSVARLIEKQDIKPIILHEQPNQGATIIEKFEKNSDVGAAICLFTADDVGRAKTEEKEHDRARQNVVFETGFFMGRLGREHLILLAERGNELPSDLKGIVYTDVSSWQLDVLREMRAMGFSVDYNKID